MSQSPTTLERAPDGPSSRRAQPEAPLAAFVERLLVRVPGLDETRRTALLLAAAALRHDAARTAGRPVQLAVLGPTQVGKSTVVNLLLGGPAASVSPLAGFTVHAQGFCVDLDPPENGWTHELFPGWPRRTPHELRRDELRAYALTRFAPTAAGRGWLAWLRGTREGGAALPGPCVVWDTPDFDSLAAGAYREGLLEVLALADAYIVVLSREKYADLAAWHMLDLIAPLRRPTLIVLNKVTADSTEALSAALTARLSERFGPAAPPILPLEYDARLRAAPVAEDLAGGPELRQRAAAICRPLSPAARTHGVAALLRAHWDAWCAPIEAEHAAQAAFGQAVARGLDEFVESYRRDFLEHPTRFDSFRRVTLELLQLLELPGVAGGVHRVRQVITWPARQALAAARSLWQRRSGEPAGPARAPEELVLANIVERLLVRLQRDAARHALEGGPGRAVWQALDQRLAAAGPRLREEFDAAVQSYRQQFAREIHEAAEGLYRRLEGNPALLNTLRAGRAAADAASIALAIKTGGVALNDLLLAPAMLAVTSMMTEGALGGYMGRLADGLKAEHLAHVRAALVDGLLRPALLGEAGDLSGAGVSGIAPAELRDARAALERWEHATHG